MKALLAVILLAAAPAWAYDCFPSLLLPQLGTGSAWTTTTTPYGTVKSWWCQLPARQGDEPGKTYWKPQFFAVHNDDLNLVTFAAAAARVASATDPLAQANAEVLAARVAIVPGSRKDYEYKQLVYLGCLDLQAFMKPTLFDPKPAGWVGPYINEPGWCGTAPVPPEGATETWMTPATGTLRLYTFSAGRLTSIISGRTAATSALCDCSVTKIMSGSSSYCPVANAAPTEVTFCKKLP